MQAGLAYHELHRGGRTSWWRALLGTLTLAFLALFWFQVVILAGFALWYLARGEPLADRVQALVDGGTTPASLAYLDLALASAVPATMFVTFLYHGWLRPGWVASVAGRIRWRWLLVCLGIAVLALLATLVVAAALPSAGAGEEMGGRLNDFTDTTRDFLLVVLFLTPLQAAGEEYAFRGYLTQAVGGVFGRRWVAVLVPAFLFALAHGAQDAPVFVDRFAFGLVAGVLVLTTGGLEAGIAMHVLNNFLAFGLALAFGDMDSTLNATAGSWWMLPTTIVQSVSYLALVTYAARRLGIATRTAGEPVGEGTVLAGRTPPV